MYHGQKPANLKVCICGLPGYACVLYPNCTKASTRPDEHTDTVSTEEGGNSIPPSKKTKETKSRGWVFTINNYTDKDIEMTQNLSNVAEWGVCGKEVGKSGTPHLQGAVYFKNARAMKAVAKLLPRAHLEVMRGRKDHQNYCIKDEDLAWCHNFNPSGEEEPEDEWIVDDPFEEFKPNEWQKELLEEIVPYKQVKRKVIWYHDEGGNSGKTTFAEHMASAHDALVVEGKAQDIQYAIAAMKKDGKRPPRYVILNVPRSANGHLSYKALEQIKDGMFFSTKYESGMIMIKHKPTVIVFANIEPDYSALTADRWDVRKIGALPQTP